MTKIVISYRMACVRVVRLFIGPNWNETLDFKVSIGYKKASTEMEEDYLMGISGGFE
jgi:hypothetical protein